MKTNSLMLKEDADIKISDYFLSKMCVANVAAFYQLAKFNQLQNLAKLTINYIQRCFTMVVESESFLQLEPELVVKILASSELHVTSELEVVNAANAWLGVEGRGGHARRLLTTVRLPLLPPLALKEVLSGSSPIASNDECVGLLERALKKENESSEQQVASRHCGRGGFSMLVCGGRKPGFGMGELVSGVHRIDGENFGGPVEAGEMTERRERNEAVHVKGHVYFFVYCHELLGVKSVEKYSLSTGCWEKVADMHGREPDDFCVCAYLDKIYVLGGYDKEFSPAKTCRLDTADSSWEEVAGVQGERGSAACAVFREKVVVCGGYLEHNYAHEIYLDTVESYDAFADEWSPMPKMIYKIACHSLVVVSDKLFVVDSRSLQAFDGERFVSLKSPSIPPFQVAVSVGKRICVLLNGTATAHCYDVEKDEWSEEFFPATENLCDFSCVTFPRC